MLPNTYNDTNTHTMIQTHMHCSFVAQTLENVKKVEVISTNTTMMILKASADMPLSCENQAVYEKITGHLI
jgi:uncharacterized protein YjaG (DUF416 family)